jgi:hypothetical protein
MPLLTELENHFIGFLQGGRAYGAANLRFIRVQSVAK